MIERLDDDLESPATSHAAGSRELFWHSRRWWARAGSASAALWTATGLSFASAAIAARALGVTGFGTVIFATSVATVVTAFLDVSLDEAVVHHGHRFLAADQSGSLRRLLKTAFVTDLVVGVAVFVILMASAGLFAGVTTGIDPFLIRLAALTAFIQTLDGTTGAALILSGRADLRAWSATCAGAMRLLFVGLLASGGPAAVLTAYAVAAAVGSSAQAALAWRMLRPSLATGNEEVADEVRPTALLRFGLHLSFATSVLAIRGGLLSILFGSLAGPSAVGILNVALLPVSLADGLSAPIRLVAYSEHVRLYVDGRFEALRTALHLQTIVGLAVGAVGGVIGWYALPTLIPALYSSRFNDAVAPARLLLLVAILNLALSWTKTLPSALGRPALRTNVVILDVAVLAVLIAILGPRGPFGAATAVAVSTLCFSAAWLTIASHLVGFARRRPSPLPSALGQARRLI